MEVLSVLMVFLLLVHYDNNQFDMTNCFLFTAQFDAINIFLLIFTAEIIFGQF